MRAAWKTVAIFFAVTGLFVLAMCGFAAWAMWADMIREWSGKAFWGYPIAVAPLIMPVAVFIAVAYHKGKLS